MKSIIVCLSLVMVACGKVTTPDPRTITSTNPEFIPYIQMFEKLYGRKIGDIPIGFENIMRPTIGQCTRWTSGYKQIRIDPSYWQTASEPARIGLIFHELGHCELNRDHLDTVHYYSGIHIAGDIPDSIMYPYNFFNYSYEELSDYYFYELFHGKTPTLIASKTGCVVDEE